MNIKLAEWDFDGTIVGTEDMNMQYIMTYLDRFGITYTKEGMMQLNGANRAIRAGIYDRLFGDQLNYRIHRDDLIAVKVEPQVDLASVVSEGVEDFLKYLCERKIPNVLCTNSYSERVWKGLEEIGLRQYFAKCYSGAECRHSKPDPTIYEMAMKEYGVRGEETLILEDSQMGIEGGKKAGGLVAALIDKGGFADQRGADIRFHDFRELIPLVGERYDKTGRV